MGHRIFRYSSTEYTLSVHNVLLQISFFTLGIPPVRDIFGSMDYVHLSYISLPTENASMLRNANKLPGNLCFLD